MTFTASKTLSQSSRHFPPTHIYHLVTPCFNEGQLSPDTIPSNITPETIIIPSRFDARSEMRLDVSVGIALSPADKAAGFRKIDATGFLCTKFCFFYF